MDEMDTHEDSSSQFPQYVPVGYAHITNFIKVKLHHDMLKLLNDDI